MVSPHDLSHSAILNISFNSENLCVGHAQSSFSHSIDKYQFVVDIFIFFVTLGRLFMPIYSAKFHTTVLTNSQSHYSSISLVPTNTNILHQQHTTPNTVYLRSSPSPGRPNSKISPFSSSLLPHQARPDFGGSGYQEIHEPILHSAT